MRAVRIVALLVALACLAYGIYAESHAVAPLGGGPGTEVSGFEFTARATYEGLIRQDGSLRDAFGQAPATARQKDCRT